MSQLYPILGCRVEQVVRRESTRAVLVVRAKRRGAQCPSCEEHSEVPHSIYIRRPAGLPTAGRSVQLELHVRRFRCRNARCARRTFSERLLDLLAPSARRTCRLARAQCSVGMTAGAEAGARLLVPLAMPTSPDTLLRLMHRTPLPPSTPPRVLGVDDWAWRKGRTYGSLLVDLEAQRVVDLLPDRSAPTLTSWRRRHPGVEVVTRDRSTEYARATMEGAPHAQQVADRWHLLLNGRQMVERWLAGAHARLRTLPPVSSAHDSAKRRHASFPRTRSEGLAREDSRARRFAVYQAVRERHLAGESLLKSAAPCDWRGERCAGTPRRRAFPSARRVYRVRAFSTPI
ncbi:ISL3 family transposase [Cystobacter fuscus]|uniref:ISL3 family transposase n=1 Tax=Cystobacter fuscus TaxID=43 RepID=UPI002B2DB6BF|nr:ISL3 family transposase [Cystobacter fuscus]